MLNKDVSFEFLTASTGHTCIIHPFGDVTAEIIALLTPLVQKGAGAVPNRKGYSASIQRLHDGVFQFDISGPSCGSGPITRCVLCLSNEAAKKAWDYVLAFSNDGSMMSLLSAIHTGAVHPPKTSPWLTAIFVDLPCNPTDMFWIADLEKCLAVTIMQLQSEGK